MMKDGELQPEAKTFSSSPGQQEAREAGRLQERQQPEPCLVQLTGIPGEQMSIEDTFSGSALPGSMAFQTIAGQGPLEKGRVDSWEEFLVLVERLQLHPYKSAFFFRGQSDAAWGLLPSFARPFCDYGVSAVRAIEIERDILQQFRSQAHLWLPQPVIPSRGDTLAWWMLMQHYRAPTRLLDWSVSPFVAAYFAASDYTKDGALWLFHAGSVQDFNMRQCGTVVDLPKGDRETEVCFFSEDAPPQLLFVQSLNKSDRMVAQQGLVTVCRQPLNDHAELMAGSRLMFKVVVPATLKPLFVSRLRSMNVTANALFPGADGLGASISELVQLSAWTCSCPQFGK